MGEPHLVSCPSAEELGRVVGVTPDAALRGHLDGCARCQAEWQSLSALRGLLHELPTPAPEPRRVEAVRTALLAAPLPRRLSWTAPRRMAGLAAAGLLAAGLLVLVLRGVEAGPRGTVQALGPARFQREDIRHDEVIHLRDGQIRVDVEPLRRGERFRVQVGESEVEVRGTSFEVTARADKLVRVLVHHGVVEVRAARRAPVLLRAQQVFEEKTPRATAEAPPGQEVPVPKVAQPAEPAKVVERSVEQPPPSEAPAPPRERHRPRSTAKPEPASPADAPTPQTDSPPTDSLAPAPTVTAAPVLAPPAPAPEASAADASAPLPTPALRLDRTDPADRSFGDAYQALRGGAYQASISGFQQAIRLAAPPSPSADERPIAEDARFFLGIAQARAEKPAEATRTLRAFVDDARYAQSARRWEAAAILGVLLLRAGATAEAERRLRVALGAPFPRVRRSAAAALQQLPAPR